MMAIPKKVGMPNGTVPGVLVSGMVESAAFTVDGTGNRKYPPTIRNTPKKIKTVENFIIRIFKVDINKSQ